jgi:uncharacterized protein YgiM (DUF1202 family)
MVKLLAILLLGMYLTLQIGGVDNGRVRPGLVGVAPAAEAPAVATENAPEVETASLESADAALPEVEVARAAVAPVAAPDVVAAAEPALPATGRQAATASTGAAPVVAVRAERVFTLSALPGQPQEEEVAAASSAGVDAPVTIWYVTGKSLNVRAEPSTDAAILSRLRRGEEALVVATTADGWAEIRIEGDGVSGFVSMDYLSTETP